MEMCWCLMGLFNVRSGMSFREFFFFLFSFWGLRVEGGWVDDGWMFYDL
jgi:hypothetical protein